MADNYLSALGENAVQEISDYTGKVKELAAIIVDTNGKIRGLWDNDKGWANFVANAAKAEELIKRLEKATNDYAKAKLNEAKAETEASKQRLNDAKAKTEQAKADKLSYKERIDKIKAMKQEQKELKELDNAYKLLSKAYADAREKYQNYAAQFPKNHPAVVQAAEDAKRLNDRLKEIDAGIGNYQRNVGNYSSAFNGLNISINQLASELPNFAQSMRIGIMSIGNNITQLGQSIKFAQQENARLIAQGLKSVPIWRQVAAGIFSWQTALVAVIGVMTAISMHGLPAWIKGLTKEQELLNKVNEKAIDSYADEITHLNLLAREVSDTHTSTKRLKEIKDELIEQYPGLKKDLKDEKDLNGQLTTAINNVTKALILRAKVRAAEEALSEETKKQLKGEMDWFNQIGGIIMSAFLGTNKALANATNKQVKETEQNISRLTKIAEDFKKEYLASGLDDLFNDDEKKAEEEAKKRAERARKANAEVLKIRVQQEAKTNKMLSEDESDLLSSRIARRHQYAEDLVQIATIEKDAELRNKDLTEAEKLAIIEKYNLQVQKIRQDEAQFVTDLLQKEVEATEKAEDEKAKARAKSLDDQLKDIIRNINNYTDEELKIDKDSLSEKKKLEKARVQLAKETADALLSIAADVYERDLQALEEQQKMVDDNHKRKIDYINNTAQSEQERIERIREAEIQAFSDNQRIENEKRKIKNKQAAVDKANAASQVIINTATAIAAALPNIPLSVTIGFIGAAQLAKVLSTPMQQYAEGTQGGGHPGGLAMIGEGGEPEYVKERGKPGRWVTSPVIEDLSVGAHVVPLSHMVATASGKIVNSNTGVIMSDIAILKSLHTLNQTIKNKPTDKVIQQPGLLRIERSAGNRRINYLRKRLYE